MTRYFVCIVCLALTGTAAADLLEEVRCREVGFAESVANRDLDAFRSYIDADARFVGSDITRGVDAVAEAWKVFFDPEGPRIVWRPQFVEVLEDGALALTRGPYRLTAKDADGNTVEHWGTFNSIWRLNDDGTWRVVFDAGNPAASAPADEVRALLDAADDGC